MYRPAQAALLPQLARSPQQMAAANAVWNGIESGAFVIGAMLGGWVIGGMDPGVAFAIIALPYVVSALFLAGIPRDPVPPHRERIEGSRVRDEALAGYRTVLREPRLRTLVGVLTGSKLVEGAVDTLIVVVALDQLGLAESSVGYLNALWGVGGVVGMVVALGLLHRGRLAVGLILGCLLIGAPLLVLAGLTTVAAAATGLLILGLGYALVEIAGETLMQRLASDEVLARVFGVLEGTYMAATGIGAALAPLLVALVGVDGALLVVGLALPLLALARWRALARYESGAAIPERPFQLLRGVPLFAPLPVAVVENLTLRVERGRRRGGRGRHPPGRGRRPVLRHRRGTRRGPRRRPARARGGAGRVLRRDRAAARGPAHRDRPRARRRAADRARPRRVRRLGHRQPAIADRGRHASSASGSTPPGPEQVLETTTRPASVGRVAHHGREWVIGGIAAPTAQQKRRGAESLRDPSTRCAPPRSALRGGRRGLTSLAFALCDSAPRLVSP